VRRTLDELLAEARARIERLSPVEALAAMAEGALMVDIRSDGARRSGVIPGSLHIPRTVLEWRIAPDSLWRTPHVRGLEQRLLVLCDHGCSSSLAAATLVDLGFRAGDVIGGFEAWQRAGLPVAPPTSPAPAGPPGMGPPEPPISRDVSAM
jgi:rhodanese-related sulfurtransferase